MTPTSQTRARLEQLARQRGVSSSYVDADGLRREASTEALVGVLAALGDELSPPGDQGPLDPTAVLVAWDGRLGSSARRLLDRGAICLESGEALTAAESSAVASGETPLPFGFHELLHEPAGGEAARGTRHSFVVSAPTRPPAVAARSWGVFAPTYALRDERRLGWGDLTALETLGTIVGGWRGRYVATLPLLAQLPPSRLATGGGAGPATPALPNAPYSPVSRQFWDERLLDMRRLPELSPELARLERPPPPGSSESLELLALGYERLESGIHGRCDAFRRYLAARPELERYGAYRVLRSTPGGLGRPSPLGGPAGSRAGDPGRLARAHVYAQWATDAQLGEVAAVLAGAGTGLVLDLPVGCVADGFDAIAYPGCYAAGASIGAPPDDFFSAGQNWALAPPHPVGERTAGYPVTRAALAQGFRHAAMLRVDHVMGWQRLWWVPTGLEAADGAYVSYHPEELIALACLEAWRHDAAIVGEDLGTVDHELRQLLDRHGIAGMDVAIFDLGRGLPTPRKASMALVDTHDTVTFSGWCNADDIELRAMLGLLDAAEATAAGAARREERTRIADQLRAAGHLRGGESPSEVALLPALLEHLGESEAAVVVVGLEDLWGERDQQNVPGTIDEHPNFSRPLARSLESIAGDGLLATTLGRLDAARRRTAAGAVAAGAVAAGAAGTAAARGAAGEPEPKASYSAPSGA